MGKRKVEIKGPIRKKTAAYRLANLAMFKFHSAYVEKTFTKKAWRCIDSLNVEVREELYQESNREEKEKS